MSNGQITNNVSLAASILVQLLAQAGTVATTIQTAQAAGTDITDAQLDQLFSDDAAARAQLTADIAAARQGGTPVAST